MTGQTKPTARLPRIDQSAEKLTHRQIDAGAAAYELTNWIDDRLFSGMLAARQSSGMYSIELMRLVDRYLEALVALDEERSQ